MSLEYWYHKGPLSIEDTLIQWINNNPERYSNKEHYLDYGFYFAIQDVFVHLCQTKRYNKWRSIVNKYGEDSDKYKEFMDWCKCTPLQQEELF